jgi:glycosyltransferase involved in cell wall biosynthesis
MAIRIGYLTPEFPGQTHTFIWRERQFIMEDGFEIDLVSTRKPPERIISQSWAKEAQALTTYLLPLTLEDAKGMVGEILRAGPLGWLRCLKSIACAKGVSLPQRLRLVVVAVLASKLAWLARKQGWSHVHVHSCAEAAHIAMFASRLSGITYSLALLGPTLEQYGPNQEYKWKHAAFGLVISKLLYKHVKKVLAGYLPPQVEFAVMAVDTAAFQRTKPYEFWNGQRPFKVYSCGRLNPVKGHRYLIQAVAQLRRQGLDVQLQIAGEDEKGGTGYRKKIEQLIKEESLEAHVELLGAVSEEQHRHYLETADLFAMGSLNEGISVAAMEAMALEMPVVMTRVGGMHELIDSGVNGVLVEPQQPDNLAQAIAQIMQDEAFALQLSRNARQKVVEQFDSRLGAEVLRRNLEIVMNDKFSSFEVETLIVPKVDASY